MSTKPSPATQSFPAPAKLNLFLHVTGRRDDGYHLLQSAFQLIDWCDTVHLTVRDDGLIRRTGEVPGVPAAQDLTVRAAALLQQASGCRLGVDIAIDKRLPQGGGLGGGSSDAATTLLALNHLWGLHWPRTRLAALGLQLGADVPFFVGGRTAFVSGIGEELTPIDLPDRWFAVIHPGQAVPTPMIFSDPQLTRDHPPVRISDFLDCQHPWSFGSNDLQAVATGKFAEVGQALALLGRYDLDARMTGSGACVFASFATEQEARNAVRDIPSRWTGAIARSLSCHPLIDLSA